jgi:N-acetylglutamate synthase-like GNAT family acetyltransferase
MVAEKMRLVQFTNNDPELSETHRGHLTDLIQLNAKIMEDYVIDYDKCSSFVAVLNNKVLGGIVFKFSNEDKKCILLELITVKERARNNGIGGSMIKHLQDYVRDNEMHGIHLYSVQLSTKLYERLNFTKVPYNTQVCDIICRNKIGEATHMVWINDKIVINNDITQSRKEARKLPRKRVLPITNSSNDLVAGINPNDKDINSSTNSSTNQDTNSSTNDKDTNDKDTNQDPNLVTDQVAGFTSSDKVVPIDPINPTTTCTAPATTNATANATANTNEDIPNQDTSTRVTMSASASTQSTKTSGSIDLVVWSGLKKRKSEFDEASVLMRAKLDDEISSARAKLAEMEENAKNINNKMEEEAIIINNEIKEYNEMARRIFTEFDFL